MFKYADLISKMDTFYLLSTADKVYGPYLNSDRRRIVIVKDDNGNTRTLTLAKYIMEQHLGRLLNSETETVDHINRDKNDNDINNLRLVERSQHSKDDTRRVKLVKFKCSLCNKDFERSPRLVRDKSKKGVTGIFCSRQCAGRYSRKVQLGLMDKFPVQPYVESEYYRNIKNLEAVSNYLIAKYAKDYEEVDPQTGTAKPIPFQVGDLVMDKKSGRIAKFLTPAYWDNPNIAIVQFVNKDERVDGKLKYHPVALNNLEKVQVEKLDFP